MGLFKKSCYTNPTIDTAPNPEKFKIIQSHKQGNYWVSLIRYPNCTNFEGKKILLTNFDPAKKMALDPHFSQDAGIIARFVPNTLGWNLAITAAAALNC